MQHMIKDYTLMAVEPIKCQTNTFCETEKVNVRVGEKERERACERESESQKRGATERESKRERERARERESKREQERARERESKRENNNKGLHSYQADRAGLQLCPLYLDEDKTARD